MILESLFQIIKDPNNKSKVITAVSVFLVGSSLFVAKTSSNRSDNDYFRQNEVHPEEFFQTTPRIQSNEKVIIIVKDGVVTKLSQELDSKGRVVKEKEEVISSKSVRRGDEILRNGDELKNGDVIEEEIISEDGVPYRRKQILQNGEIVIVKEPLDKDAQIINAKDIDGLKEISSVERFLKGKRYVTKKFIDSNGNILTQTFDDQNNLVPEGTILSDDTILDPKEKKLKRFTNTIIGGEIIFEEKVLRDSMEGDQVKLQHGLFYFTENKDTGLSVKDEIAIQRLKNIRHRSEGSFSIVEDAAERARKTEEDKNGREYTISSRDKNFDAHNIAKTTPTHPVDLSRVITVDKIIPAVLINEIKSDIPSSTVKAQIEEDVYASHGRKILIPKGSKAIGTFKQVEDKAAKRMFIAWYRIITPDGINIKLESELSDAVGMSGMEGEVDNRYKDRYGLAFMLSSMNALAQLSVPVNDLRYRGAADTFTREFSATTGSLIREGLKIMPSINIPQGARINISPLQDIWFSEPKNKQIIIKEYKENV